VADRVAAGLEDLLAVGRAEAVLLADAAAPVDAASVADDAPVLAVGGVADEPDEHDDNPTATRATMTAVAPTDRERTPQTPSTYPCLLDHPADPVPS
jgi:hypothetical protein